MIQRFVIAGKASTVFSLIEAKAKREAALEMMMRQKEGRVCRYDSRAKCSVPVAMSCSLIDCPVFIRLFGRKER